MTGKRTLTIEIAGDASGASRAFGQINDDAGKSSTALANFGIAAAAGLGAAGVGAFKLGSDFDAARGTIARATGATGEDLDALYGSFKNSVGQVPDDMGLIAETIGSASTLFGATGTELENVSVRLADFSRLSGGDAPSNMEALGRAASIFGVDATQATQGLDDLFKITQDYGVAGDALLGQLQQFGPIFSNAGFGMEETAAIMGELHAAGIDLTRVGPGFNRFFRDAAEAGKDPQKALGDTIDAIRDAEDASVALTIATDAFGAEGAQRLTNAIRDGGISLEGFSHLLGQNAGLIDNTAAATATATEKFRELWNRGLVFIEPGLTAVFGAGMRVLDAFAHIAENFDRYKAPIIGVATALGVGLVSGLVAATAANWTFSTSMAATAAPFIAAGVAIGGLVAGFVWLYDNVEWFREGVDGLITFFTDTVIPGFDALADAYVAAFQNAWDLSKPILGYIGDRISNLMGIAQGVVDFITSVFKGDWDAAWGALKDIFTETWDYITAPLEAFGELLGGVKDTIVTAAVGLFDPIWDAFKGTVNAIIDGWNQLDPSISISVPGWVPGIGGKGWQSGDIIPDLPRLHGGGIYVPPTGQQEGVVMLRRGERVTTPGQAVAATPDAPVGAVRVFIDSHEIVNAVVEYDHIHGPVLGRLQGGIV